jgi:NSS family neurotransmitter:Na+ symporter
VLAGLLEVVIIVWVAKKLKTLQLHANSISDIAIGGWWKICLGFITPLVLGYMTVQNTITNIKENYEGYPTSFLLYSGWGVAILALVVGIIFAAVKWKKPVALKEGKEIA